MISKQAKFVETMLRSFGMRTVISRMMLHPPRKGKYEKPPKHFYKEFIISSASIDHCTYVTLSKHRHPPKHILYFHGGAYSVQASFVHWKTIEYLLKHTDCMITFVNYPLAPENSCIDTIETVNKIFALLCRDQDQELILMGDSAGAGIALALAQSIEEDNNLPTPTKIVLFSPWLDVSMEDFDAAKRQSDGDFLLDAKTLQTIGKIYAGSLSTKNPLCSPLYGSLSGIGAVAIFTGTSDLLNHQAKILANKLTACNQSFSYYEYERMQHVWISFPIPEAQNAMDQAIRFLENKSLE